VVTYRIRDGVLTRRESRAVRDLLQLDALWAAAISDSDATPGVVLQNGVQSMAVRGWRDGGWQAVAGVQASQGQNGQGAQANAAVQDLDGLELSLQLQGQAGPLVKAFLMGEK
jgi:general secretion pathway protein J